MNQDLFAFFVAALLFVSGIGGLAYQAWGDRGDEEVSETRDLVNRLTGLVATLSALVLGLLIAGAIAAWVPDSFWGHFFFSDDPTWSTIWGPIIGPVVAIVSFVCSIGNVPLAAVLITRFVSTGGIPMLRMMGGSPDPGAGPGDAAGGHHHHLAH